MGFVDRQTLGETVRKFRMEIGYSQDSLAKALDCSRSAYSYKEGGKCAFSIEDLQQLAVVFNLPLEAFFQPEQYPEKEIGIRVRRKPVDPPEQIGDLRMRERVLISRLRMLEEKLDSNDLIEQFWETMKKELDKLN